jgi:hypothetical protein
VLTCIRFGFARVGRRGVIHHRIDHAVVICDCVLNVFVRPFMVMVGYGVRPIMVVLNRRMSKTVVGYFTLVLVAIHIVP